MKYPLALIHVLLAFCALSGCSTEKPERPNIVLIMADDIGLGDVGRYHQERTGSKPIVPTPNIDSLAEQGMWFTDAHSPTALCSPTRYCVMSGNNPYRSWAKWGVWRTYAKTPFKEGEATLGSVAKNAGYATAFVGKWHLGGDFYHKNSTEIFRDHDHTEVEIDIDSSKWIGGGPHSIGFDYSLVLPTGIQGPVYIVYENGAWLPIDSESELTIINEETVLDPAYISDKGPGMGDSKWDPRPINEMIARKSADFIEKHAGEKPFFLCYWTPAVHLPHIPADQVNGVAVKGEAPSHHLDMVIALDQEVRIIVDALKESGVYDNTMIIFTSDNGGLSDRMGQEAGHDSSGGWRGFKNQAYEGGHRVPFIVSWPERIEANSVSDEPVVGTDILSTIAAVVGEAIPNDQAKDSHNILPELLGDESYVGRSMMLLQSGSRAEVIFREGSWKLIIDTDYALSFWEPIALFNLDDSPNEDDEDNLIDSPEHAERVEDMFKRYMEIRESGARTVPGV